MIDDQKQREEIVKTKSGELLELCHGMTFEEIERTCFLMIEKSKGRCTFDYYSKPNPDMMVY